MFEAAVSGFVKAVGKDSLLPVPDLNSANKCRPLHIAVKKNPKWFWQSAKYLPTSFKVHQILYVKSNNPGQDFLEALDFGIQDVGNKKSLVTEDDGKRLYAAQQAVYGLWGAL
uniref:GSDMES3 n=1 Tax=Branchiostoma belcheri TaxID=7741 RepID=A0A9E8WJ44_BRABE|nr:GSDMES3 [Branchiostoma belcheri]